MINKTLNYNTFFIENKLYSYCNMKIISQILLLSLIFVISCDKDSVSSDEEEESFSIVGTWKNDRYTNDGGSSWNNTGSSTVYNFRSNGSYTVPGVTSYYKLCES